jgi:hypothetical protein
MSEITQLPKLPNYQVFCDRSLIYAFFGEVFHDFFSTKAGNGLAVTLALGFTLVLSAWVLGEPVSQCGYQSGIGVRRDKFQR